MYIGNKVKKINGNILSLSENIAKSFMGGYFLTHTVYACFYTFFLPSVTYYII